MPTAAKAKSTSAATGPATEQPGELSARSALLSISKNSSAWTPTGARPTISPSARSTCKDNPLLRRPLTRDDIKPRLLGHFGTTPGLNFIYLHLNRIIRHQHANMMLVVGPGHGAPGIVANTYLEGTYTEVYPDIERNHDGLKRLFRQFSWPYGIPSHDAPNVPGSIHEGGELGYSLLHAYGAAFDNPDLLVACIVGDGEAETGSLAASWHSNKFLNPITDGAVLPILHLNGYKIANPTVLARIEPDELKSLFEGYGYTPYFLEGDDPAEMHRRMAETLDTIYAEIRRIQQHAREKQRRHASPLAHAHPAHAQRLDRPQSSSMANRSKAPGVPIKYHLKKCAPTRSISSFSKSGFAPISPKISSTKTAACTSPSPPSRRAASSA